MIVYERFEIEDFRGHDFTIHVEGDVTYGRGFDDEPPWAECDITSMWRGYGNKPLSDRLQNAILNEYGDDYFAEVLIEEAKNV